MYIKFNIQYLLSYLGLIPLIYLIVNKYYFFQINEITSHSFTIYYTLIIFVFIGATNWNLNKKIDNLLAFYGFLPSLISVFIITLDLLGYSKTLLLLFIIFSLSLQLIFDYYFIYSKDPNKKTFFLVRLPLTIIINIILVIILN